MSQSMQRRTESHAAGEPAQLFGRNGALQRGVYSYATPDGRDLWVCISAEGRVIASVEMPTVPRRDPGGLAAEAWQHSLGKAWVELERLDSCVDAGAQCYPDFAMAPPQLSMGKEGTQPNACGTKRSFALAS